MNGQHRATMTLTSRYAWLYNQYPFTNDPHADLLHPDWWITECDCVPAQTNPPPVITKSFRPSHFYDEQRLLLGRAHRAGDTIRLTASDRAAWTVIDLLDTELVARPHVEAGAFDVRWFGADPTGRRDAAPAIERAVALARLFDVPVYLPPGTFRVNRHIVVDDVTIVGAGSWHTIVRGREVALDPPAPDGSVHTGVGFYGRSAAEGGSVNVHLSGFTIEGDVRERIDTDQVVDALNFHTGVTDSVVANDVVRNTGDDGLAMWAEHTQNARNTFDHNTMQSPVLANGIALYGGTDNTVSHNLVADPVREGSGIQLGSRFGAQPFTGHVWVSANTTVRAGTYELNWDIGLGAIWFYALERDLAATVLVVGNHFLDNTYNAIMFVSDWPVKDRYSITDVHVHDTRVDGTGTSVLSARAKGAVSFANTDARNVGAVGVNNCGSFNFPPAGSELAVTDLGGNDGGWLAPWMLPNTITCDDRPPAVPPPPPAPW